LKGKSLATPSLGNTQDVAARYWLKQHGLTTTATGGGDVAIKPIKPNPAAVLQFKSGQLDGGWEPAPYPTQMVVDRGDPPVAQAARAADSGDRGGGRRNKADEAELGRRAPVQVRPARRRLGAGALRDRDGARRRDPAGERGQPVAGRQVRHHQPGGHAVVPE